MADYVPRRLRRFYRNGENPQVNQEREYSQREKGEQEYSQNIGQPRDDWGFEKEEQFFNDGQRNDLERIPSMDYEDLNIKEKNLKDLANFEKRNNEAYLAENEIEKFKRTNKRMPNKQESEKIAENLYVQLKDNPIDYGEQTQGLSRRELRRHGRNHREDQQMQGTMMPGQIPEEEITPKPVENSKQKVNDIKSIIEDQPRKKKIEADEFDLGLGDENSGEISFSENDEETESIDDLANMNLNLGGETCPNCKKSTEKIIYCSKCGTAYCKSCAKQIEGNELTCPKCGAKTKN